MFGNHPEHSRALKDRTKIFFRSFLIEVNVFKLQMKNKYAHRQWNDLSPRLYSTQQIEIQSNSMITTWNGPCLIYDNSVPPD